MQFDTSLSLELVVTILAIFGAAWRLNRDIDRNIDALRAELKNDIADFRKEQKADYKALQREVKAVDDKVDASNQRLARLEGVILSREGLVEAITSAEPSA